MGELKEKASDYSQAFGGAPALADEEGRARKAAKIRAVLAAERMYDRADLRILDIGCSFGIILKFLTPAGGFGIGIDMDKHLGQPTPEVSFIRGDAEALPFAAQSFDVVVCNHVYEHTDDAGRLLDEIHRVLKDSGVCYFAGPNKYDVIEPHYRLPFLSWLPRNLADAYMRITGKGTAYVEKPCSPPVLRRLLHKFEIINYTEKILRHPDRFAATDMLPVASLKRRFAIMVYKTAPFFFPGFVYILRKA